MVTPAFDAIVAILGSIAGTTDRAVVATILAEERDWVELIALADHRHVLAALHPAIDNLGLTGALPQDVAELLAFVHQANVARNGQLRASLADAVRALNAIDVTPVLLKGAIRLVDDLYSDPGMRMMADLDILIPADRAAESVEALCGAGFVEDGDLEVGHHLVRLARPLEGVAIELHVAVHHTHLPLILAADDVRASAVPVAIGANRALVPCRQHQLLHLMIHDQLSNDGFVRGALRPRAFLEAQLLLGTMTATALCQVVARLDDCGQLDIGAHFLAAVQLLTRSTMQPLHRAGMDRRSVALALSAQHGDWRATLRLWGNFVAVRAKRVGWLEVCMSAMRPASWRAEGRKIGDMLKQINAKGSRSRPGRQP